MMMSAHTSKAAPPKNMAKNAVKNVKRATKTVKRIGAM